MEVLPSQGPEVNLACLPVVMPEATPSASFLMTSDFPNVLSLVVSPTILTLPNVVHGSVSLALLADSMRESRGKFLNHEGNPIVETSALDPGVGGLLSSASKLAFSENAFMPSVKISKEGVLAPQLGVCTLKRKLWLGLPDTFPHEYTSAFLEYKRPIEYGFEEVSQTDNISCQGSVDTTINGVDTMVQNKGRNVKKSPSQVDTSPEQVDTREPSQKACCSDSQSRSTPNSGRSTLDGSPRRPVDTRDLSQGIVMPVWDSVSTHLLGRSTHSGISVT
ncbi:hypothetical protein Taro_030547 [Colocasia esculenta]|uniref:Uncharacterized protein n=1 Tax=Colocasia esculenta TaxID=4460 RepID=A0A843VGL5_COLES|nr:hypothetical protein [Colocasia esculenta]